MSKKEFEVDYRKNLENRANYVLENLPEELPGYEPCDCGINHLDIGEIDIDQTLSCYRVQFGDNNDISERQEKIDEVNFYGYMATSAIYENLRRRQELLSFDPDINELMKEVVKTVAELFDKRISNVIEPSIKPEERTEWKQAVRRKLQED